MMHKLMIDGVEVEIIKTDEKNNMVLIEYVANMAGKIKLIQEWKMIAGSKNK